MRLSSLRGGGTLQSSIAVLSGAYPCTRSSCCAHARSAPAMPVTATSARYVKTARSTRPRSRSQTRLWLLALKRRSASSPGVRPLSSRSTLDAEPMEVMAMSCARLSGSVPPGLECRTSVCQSLSPDSGAKVMDAERCASPGVSVGRLCADSLRACARSTTTFGVLIVDWLRPRTGRSTVAGHSDVAGFAVVGGENSIALPPMNDSRSTLRGIRALLPGVFCPVLNTGDVGESTAGNCWIPATATLEISSGSGPWSFCCRHPAFSAKLKPLLIAGLQASAG
jgi:hypothetical protein